MKLSVIIPARNERFLPQTINDLLTKARGDLEVIAVLDGYWPDSVDGFNYQLWLEVINHKNLIVLHRGRSMGMRAAINAAANVSRGDYLLKCDGHCLFSEGYDVGLLSEIYDNWIVIPRRHSLDAENWKIEENRKPPRDYHYLCYPDPNKDHDGGIHGVEWPERGRQRSEFRIDETMSFQGSCWIMKKSWFSNFLGGMSENGYGTFAQEPQEIGNKTWLGGGQVMVNKNVWYAHLHKGKRYGRMYSIGQSEIINGHNWSAWYWMNNQWEKRIHDIDWLIEKFWPVPTWPENWKEVYYANAGV